MELESKHLEEIALILADGLGGGGGAAGVDNTKSGRGGGGSSGEGSMKAFLAERPEVDVQEEVFTGVEDSGFTKVKGERNREDGAL